VIREYIKNQKAEDRRLCQVNLLKKTPSAALAFNAALSGSSFKPSV
jgi:hypothetical protein